MNMYCTNCGAERAAGNKFCGQCGLAFESGDGSAENAGKIFLKNSERRVRVGSVSPESNEEIFEVGGVWVDPNSEEAKSAGTEFDPKRIPSSEDLVPADCIWSIHPYPGKPNVKSSGAQKAMTEMGKLVGRPYDEIVKYAGAPNSRQTNEEGMLIAVWMEMGFFSAWSVTLVFDSYGVCGTVANETAF